MCVLANPCQNGATCAEVDGIDVDCTCAEGYTGSVCETGMIFMRFLCNVQTVWTLPLSSSFGGFAKNNAYSDRYDLLCFCFQIWFAF